MTKCLKKLWQRARSPEQKQERIEAILAAAAQLHERCEWEEITLAAIGHEAGFTRSNLYKYFQTKEEIYLELMKADLSNWRGSVEVHLATVEATPQAFASTWVNLLLANRRLTQHMSILSTTLERNVSFVSLVAYKVHVLTEFTRVGEAIMRLFPILSLAQITSFIWAQFAFSIGMIHLLDQSEMQKRAMTEAGIECSETMLKKIFVGSMKVIFEKYCFAS